MKTETNEITINGKVYVEKGSELSPAAKRDGMKYVICRSYSAGVFAGKSVIIQECSKSQSAI